jgi:hypothetical protein
VRDDPAAFLNSLSPSFAHRKSAPENRALWVEGKRGLEDRIARGGRTVPPAERRDPGMRVASRIRRLRPRESCQTTLTGAAERQVAPAVTSCVSEVRWNRRTYLQGDFQAIGVTPARSTHGSGQMQAQRLRDSGRAAASMGEAGDADGAQLD